jgi:hypothetical protein
MLYPEYYYPDASEDELEYNRVHGCKIFLIIPTSASNNPGANGAI